MTDCGNSTYNCSVICETRMLVRISLFLSFIPLFMTRSFTDKNIFFSPLSVAVALSMALLGARNRTAEQLLTSFKLTKNNATDWHTFLGTVSKSGDKAPMTVANKMFVEQSFAVLSAYVEELKKLYAIEHGEVRLKRLPKRGKFWSVPLRPEPCISPCSANLSYCMVMHT